MQLRYAEAKHKVDLLKADHVSGLTYAEIATKHNVRIAVVVKLVNRRRAWGDFNSSVHMQALRKDHGLNIRKDHAEGVSVEELAVRYESKPTFINKIINAKYMKGVNRRLQYERKPKRLEKAHYCDALYIEDLIIAASKQEPYVYMSLEERVVALSDAFRVQKRVVYEFIIRVRKRGVKCSGVRCPNLPALPDKQPKQPREPKQKAIRDTQTIVEKFDKGLFIGPLKRLKRNTSGLSDAEVTERYKPRIMLRLQHGETIEQVAEFFDIRLQLAQRYLKYLPPQRFRNQHYFDETSKAAVRLYVALDAITDSNARKELYERHIHGSFVRLAEFIVNLNKAIVPKGCTRPDAMKNLVSSGYQALDKFDPLRSTNPFSYFNVVFKNAFIHLAMERKCGEQWRHVSIDQHVGDETDTSAWALNEAEKALSARQEQPAISQNVRDFIEMLDGITTVRDLPGSDQLRATNRWRGDAVTMLKHVRDLRDFATLCFQNAGEMSNASGHYNRSSINGGMHMAKAKKFFIALGDPRFHNEHGFQKNVHALRIVYTAWSRQSSD